MAVHSEARVLRLGAISLVVLLLVMAAAFNLQKFPGFRGTTMHAEFTDANGLHTGSEVQVAGIRVGRVSKLNIGADKVVVDFTVKGADLGKLTRAKIEVQNLLGEKFLNLLPEGTGEMSAGDTIPVSRTDTTYDIVGTLNQLTTTTEKTNKANLDKALETLASTLDASAPQIRSSFQGISRLSQTIASRDDELSTLLARAKRVTGLLDQRKGDLVMLMRQARLIFGELQQRKQAIHTLLVNTRGLATELDGLMADNRAQLKPTLDKLDSVLAFLNARDTQLRTLLNNYGPYVNILGNIIGSGPWFDAYVPNLTGLATGEFLPGEG